MSRLVLADERSSRAIHDETCALWGGGLTREDHHGVWADIRETAWGRRHASLHVWVDTSGEPLSSLKIYRPRIRVGERLERCPVLAAIYTPVSRRRQGHATRMVRAVLERERAAGHPVCLLFSDIGTRFYRGFGFHPLNAMEHWASLQAADPFAPPGWELHGVEPDDLAPIREAHDASTGRLELAVERDARHWEYLLARTRSFFHRLDDSEVRASFLVARRAGEFAGYLIAVEGRGEWSVREVGAVGGEPSRLAEVLRAGAARARGRGLGRFYGWLPADVAASLEDWGLRSRLRSRGLPMVLALDPALDTELEFGSARVFLSYQDQF